MIEYLKLMARQKLAPKRILNAVLLLCIAFTLLSNIWMVGRKVDQTLSYLKEIPRMRHEMAQLRSEKDATRDSLRLFRVESSRNFRQVAENLDQMDNRISNTNNSVKSELKKINEYFILLSSSNAEIKQMLILKKESDNLMLEQLFPSRYVLK